MFQGARLVRRDGLHSRGGGRIRLRAAWLAFFLLGVSGGASSAPVVVSCGRMAVLAGALGGPGFADGRGNTARFNCPSGVTTDAAGNVYVADTYNDAIRKVTPAGVVSTLAGGKRGAADDQGLGAQFVNPSGVATDQAGNVYVADTDNSTIRKITPAGLVSTLAGEAGLTGFADGPGPLARFYHPSAVAVDLSGNVYVADSGNNTIRKITRSGVVTTLAGGAGQVGFADGHGAAALFNYPAGIAVDLLGQVYVADAGNNTIRKITLNGIVTTLAGMPGVSGFADGAGSAARFNSPFGVTIDVLLNMYVADTGNKAIRKVTPSGVVTTLAGTGLSGSADGAGNAAQFNWPSGISVDRHGNVYVADTSNNTIRKMTLSTGFVSTVAGAAGSSGFAATW